MTEILLLRLIHVLGGAIWLGAGVFSAFFLTPVLGRLPGPVGGQVMGGLMKQRLFTFLPTMAVLTILSGLRLTWILSGGFSAGWFTTGPGQAYSMAGGLAIAIFAFGLLVMNPTGARMKGALTEMHATEDPARLAELRETVAGLQRRIATLSRGMTIGLLISAAGMALGRYL